MFHSITQPSREKKMSDTCSSAEERKITGEAGTTKPNSHQLPSDQTPSTPKPYNKSVKRKVFSSSQGKSFQSSPKCKVSCRKHAFETIFDVVANVHTGENISDLDQS